MEKFAAAKRRGSLIMPPIHLIKQKSSSSSVPADRTAIPNFQEGIESMLRKVQALQNVAREIEGRLPLSTTEFTDDMEQLKHFILTYYKPVMTQAEI